VICPSSFFVVVVYFFETGSYYVVQAGLELVILLPQAPEIIGVFYHTRPPSLFSEIS
jgi:hypothetical protein